VRESPELTQRETDAALVERLRAGDVNAYTELYRAHSPAVGAAVRERVRDRDAQSDVIQEAFALALERLDSLRDPGAFRPWLLAIARNSAVDHLRSQGRLTELDEDAAAALPDHGEPSPQEWAELTDLAGVVRSTIARLSQRDATAVAMVTQFNLSTEDLAAALGLSTNAAKVALHRARRRLRHALRVEVLARRRAGGCDELHRLYDADRLTEAGQHLEACTECSAASREVVGFARSPAPGQ
jgi:RNA polymerase sigma factor (sigma-70 family)